MRYALLLLTLLFAAALPAQAQSRRDGEFELEFPRELIGYRKGGQVVTPSTFPTLDQLEQTLGAEETRAVLFFKLYEDEHNHYAPKFAPGADELLFLRADLNRRTSKIRRLLLGAGGARTLMEEHPDSYDYMAEYAPRYPWQGEARLKAFASQAGGQMNLYLTGGKRAFKVTSGKAITKHPSFHPSEPKLLFEARGRVSLVEFPKQLDELREPPAPTVIAPGAQPSWSPDGRGFVYCREVGRVADRPTYEVSVRSHPFGRERRLYRGPATEVVRNPTWSPDGKYVAFYRRGGEAFGWELCVAEVATSQVRSLARQVVVEHNFDDVDPSWSPRGDRLLFFTTADAEDGYYRIHWADVTGKRGTIDYSDEFTTATDLALPRAAGELPQVAFVATERLSQGLYIVVLNHW